MSTGETGLRQLLSEMRSELLRFMLARQCDPAEVEDLLQDLYVKLASILQRRRLLANRCLNRLARAGRAGQ